MKVKYLLSNIILGSLFLIAAPAVQADGCTSQYGGYNGCVPSNISINKKVHEASASGVFVENVTEGMMPFGLGSDVLYELTITNNSDQEYSSVAVKDVLPSQLTFVSGPGSYDKTNHTVYFTLENFKKGETRKQQILAKIGGSEKFSKDTSLHCEVVNTATVTVSDKKPESDTSSICVQTKVLGASTLPVAGFNELALIAGFFAMGVTGVVLTKKT